jgi:hypothetical protein
MPQIDQFPMCALSALGIGLADSMAWDMEDMGAVMFIPIVFCLHIVIICLGSFTGEQLTHLQRQSLQSEEQAAVLLT